MAISLRHVALCTASLWEREKEVIRLLDIAPVCRDDGVDELGFVNAVFVLNSTFLELVAPASADSPTRRFYNRFGEAGYMVCLQVDDIDAAMVRAGDAGVRAVYSIPPMVHHGVQITSRHLNPMDTGGTFFSFEQANPPESWAWGGPAWTYHRHTDVVTDLAAVTVGSANPDALVGRLGALLGVDPVGHDLPLDSGVIRIGQLDDGERDRLVEVEMTATDRARVGEVYEIAGTRIRLR